MRIEYFMLVNTDWLRCVPVFRVLWFNVSVAGIKHHDQSDRVGRGLFQPTTLKLHSFAELDQGRN